MDGRSEECRNCGENGGKSGQSGKSPGSRKKSQGNSQGKEQTGKSIFALRLWTNNKDIEFKQSNNLKYNQINGTKYFHKFIKLNNKIFKLEIFDIASDSEQNYLSLDKIFLAGCDIALLFYDSFDRKSFENIKKTYFKYQDIINYIIFLIRAKYELNI